MTPSEYRKQATLLLSELLEDTGFSKKRVGQLTRKTKECEQHILIDFTRDRGLPGTLYTAGFNLILDFKEVNRLTCKFLGEKYNAREGTGFRPLYTVIPGETPKNAYSRFKYCSDEPFNHYAERVADDFRSYALPFFKKFDSLEKLALYFEHYPVLKNSEGGFHISRSHGQNGGWDCCFAAVLCLLERWDKLNMLLKSTELLPDQKERIKEYISNR